jgi:hypothetical protein
MSMVARSFCAGRFTISETDGGYLLHDALVPPPQVLPSAAVAGLDDAARDLAFFRLGFAGPCFPPYGSAIADRPRGADDLLFWQFPARTEAAAQANHAGPDAVAMRDGALHGYVGLPWATFLEKKRGDGAQLQGMRARVPGLRDALRELGVRLQVHTVCQHIYWRALVPMWQSLGVTDVWLAHLPAAGVPDAGALPFALHPWRLHAVNVEDPERRAGLVVGLDPAEKKYLASFIGAHLGNYLSDVRLRLQALAGADRFLVRVTRDQWHFQDVVYGHQVGNAPLAESYRIDETVTEYNRVLSESVFALCPSGAGPNTLRLWEALAVGAVPVLLGPEPALPRGGSLPPIDWDAIVLRVPDEQVSELPAILSTIPLYDVRRRQRLGMEAFAQVRGQRCF